MAFSLDARAKLACLYAGAVWGLFWIPLRGLEGAGLHDLWVMVVYFTVPSLILLPVAVLRRARIRRAGLPLLLTAAASGMALTLYSASIVFTDVIRALMLFYLMPIWSAILARVLLGEPILPIRILAMSLAALGMLVLFGLGVGWPVPRNIGDWMGLAGGFFWALTIVRVRMHEDHPALDLTCGFFLWGLVLSGATALALAPGHVPTLDQTGPALPGLILFVVLLVIPGTYASLWGPKYVNAAVASLLFMTEIVVGAISAALLAGEPFGLREAIGVTLIACASLLEPLMVLRSTRAEGRGQS
ncbi:MAG: DMT family transporter [Albidovulum sp.]|nr:DMT family transporter [Albidovulum sp.]